MSEVEKTAVSTSTAEKNKKAASNQTVATAKQETDSQTVAYIGPTIPGVIVANTILSNGITKELVAVKGEVPAIGTLIVPMAKLAQAKRQIEVKDTPENICYDKVLRYLKKKKGE